ncbi:MAG: hypothetical protein RMK49_05240, partial [Abditibacteriales bacterium]|nr:hypothetical protein [Abditibacteriales bacterium]
MPVKRHVRSFPVASRNFIVAYRLARRNGRQNKKPEELLISHLRHHAAGKCHGERSEAIPAVA